MQVETRMWKAPQYALIGLGLIATFAAACIDETPDKKAPECRVDDDCAKLSDSCNKSVCESNACKPKPVVCDDANTCTTDRCDPGVGCVFSPVAAGAGCVIGTSGACVDETWHAADVCDAGGHCVDGAVTDCGDVEAAACRRSACIAEAGCTEVAGPDGGACVANGQSNVCIDDTLYLPDVCMAGVCEEAGRESCVAGFCEVATCSGSQCDVHAAGIDIDLSGAWSAFTLMDQGTLAATRTNLALVADGSIVVQDRIGPQAQVPTQGSYCVSADRTMHVAFEYAGRVETFSGHISGGRDIGFFTLDGGEGTMVLVRNRDISEARLIGGVYRIVGIDNLVHDDTSQVDAMLGTIEIKANCVTALRYGHGSDLSDTTLDASNTAACVKFEQSNSISFDVRAVGDVRLWAGVVGTGGRYAVMQRYRAGEQLIEPSLVMLVRTGLTAPEMLRGDYALNRISLSPDGDASVITGAMSLDGFDAMTTYSEGNLTLGSNDRARIYMSVDEPRSSIVSTVTIGGVLERRVGQSGQASTDLVDWFVDVPAQPDANASGPISGRSLRFGVRTN